MATAGFAFADDPVPGGSASLSTIGRTASAITQAAIVRQHAFRTRDRARREARRAIAEEPDMKQLERRTRRLAEELASAKSANAQQVAATELKCERLMREKESERNEWYKERKQEVKQLQAALVIMQSLFNRKRNRYREQLNEDRAEFARQRQTFREDYARLEEQCRTALEGMRTELAENTAGFKARLEVATAENAQMADQIRVLQGQLSERSADARHYRAEYEKKCRECQDLEVRLEEAKQAEELLRLNARIEELEAEVVRTRREWQQRNQRDCETLHRELMEYVKYIVHLLPDDPAMDVHKSNLNNLVHWRQPYMPPAAGPRSAPANLSARPGEFGMSFRDVGAFTHR